MGSNDPLSILQESLRGAPIIWKGEYPYFIHPISDGIPRMDPEVLRATRDLIVSSVDWSKVDLIVTVEAMGLPLLAAVGDATGKPTVVIRKRSYGMEGETRVDVATGYSQSTVYINDIKPGERIVIVDDVISTGGTLEPLIQQWTVGLKDEEIVDRLQKAGVPAGPVLDSAQVLSDPHMLKRGFVQFPCHPEVGSRPLGAFSWSVDGEPPGVVRSAPVLGEHNRKVVQELLQLPDDEYARLVDSGAIS